jgi:hypothetical protein
MNTKSTGCVILGVTMKTTMLACLMCAVVGCSTQQESADRFLPSETFEVSPLLQEVAFAVAEHETAGPESDSAQHHVPIWLYQFSSATGNTPVSCDELSCPVWRRVVRLHRLQASNQMATVAVCAVDACGISILD